MRFLPQRTANVDQGSATLLHCLHAQELFEVLGRVVIAAAQPQRWRDQAFLNVVPDRPAGHASQSGKFPDSVANRRRHRDQHYTTVTVTLSTVAFSECVWLMVPAQAEVVRRTGGFALCGLRVYALGITPSDGITWRRDFGEVRDSDVLKCDVSVRRWSAPITRLEPA